MAVLAGGVQQLDGSAEPGQAYFVVRVRATYNGEASSQFQGSFRLRAVGDTAVSYTTFSSDTCPTYEDRLEDPETFSGGTIEGNVCWAIDEADAESLLVFDDPSDEYPEGERPFFATR